MDYIYGQLNDYAKSFPEISGGDTDFAKTKVSEEYQITVNPNITGPEGYYLVHKTSDGCVWYSYDIDEIEDRITKLEAQVNDLIYEPFVMYSLRITLSKESYNDTTISMSSSASTQSTIPAGYSIKNFTFRIKGGSRSTVHSTINISQDEQELVSLSTDISNLTNDGTVKEITWIPTGTVITINKETSLTATITDEIAGSEKKATAYFYLTLVMAEPNGNEQVGD